MPLPHRAIQIEQKQERKDTIKAVALRLFQDRDYSAITMSDIARVAGMAKGTLYLYFTTKEALFLDIMLDLYRLWFEQLGTRIAGQPMDRNTLVGTILDLMRSTPLLGRLILIQHSILEANLDYTTARDFKKTLAGLVEAGGQILEKYLDFVPAGSGPRLILQIYGLILGLKPLSEPPPFIREVLKKEQISTFIIDFNEIFGASLSALIRGMNSNK